MTDCTRTKTKTINLGRLPVYTGPFRDNINDGIGYHKYNIVSFQGSSFINLVEGNKKKPVIIKRDSSNNMLGYSLKDNSDEWTGWFFIANALDAMYWAEKARKLVIDNFFALDIIESGEEYDGFVAGDIVASYCLEGNAYDVHIDGFDPSTGEITGEGEGNIWLSMQNIDLSAYDSSSF